MKVLFKNNIIYMILLACFFMSSCSKDDSPDEIDDKEKPENPIYAAKTYKDKAEFQFDLITGKYSIPGSDFYLENYPKQNGDREVSYFWPLSTLVNAASTLIEIGHDKQDEDIARVFRAIEAYWDSSNGEPDGFASYPPIYGGGTRFYDDNATIGIDLIEAYNVTQNSNYLELAEKCYEFAISGEDELCNGGIYWNEDERTPGHANYIKAANATGFTACLALMLFQETQNAIYLEDAKRLYEWNKENMQDPNDKLYWNHINISTKVITKTKWSYNSGIMLSCATHLYKITNEQGYLDDAKELASAIYDFFTTPSSSVSRFLPDNTPWFQTVVFRAYLDYYQIDSSKDLKYIDVFVDNMDYAWKNSRNYLGFFYEDWAARSIGRIEMLLTQACVVEMYARISKFKNEN